ERGCRLAFAADSFKRVRGMIMRTVVLGLVSVLALSATALAQPLTLTCTRQGTTAVTRQGAQLRPAQAIGESPTESVVLDLDRRTMRFGRSEMPVLADSIRVLGFLDTGGVHRTLGTYSLNRSSGMLSANLHVVGGDSAEAIISTYQCRGADGATSF